MSLKLYRRAPEGLEPSPVEPANWRASLRSPRWNPAELKNPEADVAGPRGAVLLFAGLAALTFILLVLGYGSGFWGP